MELRLVQRLRSTFRYLLNERNPQFSAITERQVSRRCSVSGSASQQARAILPASGWEDLLCALAAKIHVSIEDAPEPSFVQRIMQALHLRRRPQHIERGAVIWQVSRRLIRYFKPRCANCSSMTSSETARATLAWNSRCGASFWSSVRLFAKDSPALRHRRKRSCRY